MLTFEELHLVNRSTRPGTALAVSISLAHKASDLLIDPFETIARPGLLYGNIGVNTIMEFDDKLIPQNVYFGGSKV